MKKIAVPLLAVMAIFCLQACNKGPLKGYTKITPVFGYKMIDNKDTGTTGTQGIYLIGSAIIKTSKDSAIKDAAIGSGFNLEVPLRKEMAGSDIMKGFRKLSDGDSAVFIMLADTFFSKLNMNRPLPVNVKPGDYIKMYVQVYNILDSAEYDEWLVLKEIQEKTMARKMFDAYLETSGITTPADNNGIIRTIEKEGRGTPPKYGDSVSVHYIMLTLDGKELANTYMQGNPHTFLLGSSEVVEGLSLSLIKMKKGERSRIVLPYYLGYGAEGSPGSVAPYTHLVMDVELVNFK